MACRVEAAFARLSAFSLGVALLSPVLVKFFKDIVALGAVSSAAQGKHCRLIDARLACLGSAAPPLPLRSVGLTSTVLFVVMLIAINAVATVVAKG